MTKKILGGNPDRLSAYIRTLADLMGLREWKLTLSDTPCDDDCNAQIGVTYGRQMATIYMNGSWADEDPDDLRGTIAHELLHCHFNRVMEPIDNLSDELGRALYRATRESMKDWLELSIDNTAVAWARSLPLPGEKK